MTKSDELHRIKNSRKCEKVALCIGIIKVIGISPKN